MTFPKLVATGMSDCAPAYSNSIMVQQASVQTGDGGMPVVNVLLALHAATGSTIWKKEFSKVPIPPAMKKAILLRTNTSGKLSARRRYLCQAGHSMSRIFTAGSWQCRRPRYCPERKPQSVLPNLDRCTLCRAESNAARQLLQAAVEVRF